MKNNKKKGGPYDKQERYQIKEQLKVLVEQGLIHGITLTQLSSQLGVTRQTLRKWLSEIYDEIPVEDTQKVYKEFKLVFNRLFRESYKILQEAKTIEERGKAIKLIMELIKEKTHLMEDFFQKPKAVDNLLIGGEKDKTIQIEIVESKLLEDKKKK